MRHRYNALTPSVKPVVAQQQNTQDEHQSLSALRGNYNIWREVLPEFGVMQSSTHSSKVVDLNGPQSDKLETYVNSACARTVHKDRSLLKSAPATPADTRAQQPVSSDCFWMKLMDRRAILVLTDGDRQGLGSEGAAKPDPTKCVASVSIVDNVRRRKTKPQSREQSKHQPL